CKEENILSQWRGYSAGSYGYSLAFFSSELKDVALHSGFILGKCIYDPDLQMQIINETLEDFLTRGETGERTNLKHFVALMRYGAFFKHPSFKEEQEWRLVSMRGIKTSFRKGKSMIIPYTSLQISSARNCAI